MGEISGVVIFFCFILIVVSICYWIWFIGSINRITRSNENLELYLKYLISLISKEEVPDFDDNQTYQNVPKASEEATPDFRLMAEMKLPKSENKSE